MFGLFACYTIMCKYENNVKIHKKFEKNKNKNKTKQKKQVWQNFLDVFGAKKAPKYPQNKLS